MEKQTAKYQFYQILFWCIRMLSLYCQKATRNTNIVCCAVPCVTSIECLNVIKCRLHIDWNVKWKVWRFLHILIGIFRNSFCTSLHCFVQFVYFNFWDNECFVCVLCENDWKYVCECWFGIVLLTLNVELIVVSQSMAVVWLVLVAMLHCSLLLCRDVKSFAAAQLCLDVVSGIAL